MATVNAVFQPCRTCYMQFVLHARCMLYVFWQINDDDDDNDDDKGFFKALRNKIRTGFALSHSHMRAYTVNHA